MKVDISRLKWRTYKVSDRVKLYNILFTVKEEAHLSLTVTPPTLTACPFSLLGVFILSLFSLAKWFLSFCFSSSSLTVKIYSTNSEFTFGQITM